MKISFHNITPAPLAGVFDLHTQVWDKTLLFEKGNSYKVFAPSGKGKSTFINIIYGLRVDYSGTVKINDKNILENTANEWAEIRQKKLSIVFQDLRLFMNLTALDNIQLKAVLQQTTNSETIFEMAEMLGIKQKLNQQASTLSYGERQRIAIIRALVQPFDILLLDEPFSHLDKENSSIASNLIKEEVTKRNAGMIVTSLGHDDCFEYHQEWRL